MGSAGGCLLSIPQQCKKCQFGPAQVKILLDNGLLALQLMSQFDHALLGRGEARLKNAAHSSGDDDFAASRGRCDSTTDIYTHASTSELRWCLTRSNSRT